MGVLSMAGCGQRVGFTAVLLKKPILLAFQKRDLLYVNHVVFIQEYNSVSTKCKFLSSPPPRLGQPVVGLTDTDPKAETPSPKP